jgi:hypothetical protein
MRVWYFSGAVVGCRQAVGGFRFESLGVQRAAQKAVGLAVCAESGTRGTGLVYGVVVPPARS